MNSNINNKIPSKTNPVKLSKSSALAFRQKKAILLLFGLFGNNIRAIYSKKNNSSIFLLSNLSSELLPSIFFNKPSNLLLKFHNFSI